MPVTHPPPIVVTADQSIEDVVDAVPTVEDVADEAAWAAGPVPARAVTRAIAVRVRRI
jgi:hypothetical protein